MWYYKIFGITDKNPIDIESQDGFYFAQPEFNIEDGTYNLNGFSLIVDYNDLEQLYPSTGQEWFTSQTNITTAHSDTFIIDLTASPALPAINTLLWIGNEQVRVTGSSGSSLYVERGYNGTFPNNYWNDPDSNLKYTLRTSPHSYVGQRVGIYWKNSLVKIGVISEPPKVKNGGIVEIECDDLLTELDKNIPPQELDIENAVINMFYVMGAFRKDCIAQATGSTYYLDNAYIGEMPQIADYFAYRDPVANLTNFNIINRSFPADKFDSWFDFLKFFYKITGRFIVWDSRLERYKFTIVAEYDHLNPLQNITLKNYMKIGSTFSCSPMSGIRSVKFTFEQTPPINYALLGRQGRDLEVDMKGVTMVTRRDIDKIASEMLSRFGSIYAKLEIISHSFYNRDFIVGAYYNISDIDQFLTWQDGSSVAMYLGADQHKAIFLILKDQEKNIVAPGVPVRTTINNNEVTFGWTSEDWLINDFLACDQEADLETAERDDIGETKYFAKEYIVTLESPTTGAKLKNIRISGWNTISGIKFAQLDYTSATGTLIPTFPAEYWMYYDNIANVATAQQRFAYEGIATW